MKNAVMVIVCVVVAVVTITASAFVTVKVRSANDARIAADTTTVETTSEKEEKTNAVTTKETTTQQETTVDSANDETIVAELEYNKAYYNNHLGPVEGNEDVFPNIIFKDDGTFIFNENHYFDGWITVSGEYSVFDGSVSCNILRYRSQVPDYENYEKGYVIDETDDFKDSKIGMNHVEFKVEDGKLIIDRDVCLTKKGDTFVLN